jgi:methionine synthase I (cobalamin-dependent)
MLRSGIVQVFLAAYTHIDNSVPIRGWSVAQVCTPAEYAAHARRWVDLGVTMVGGRCGTTPAHIRAVREALGSGRR